jgi:hypothetical protein
MRDDVYGYQVHLSLLRDFIAIILTGTLSRVAVRMSHHTVHIALYGRRGAAISENLGKSSGGCKLQTTIPSGVNWHPDFAQLQGCCKRDACLYCIFSYTSGCTYLVPVTPTAYAQRPPLASSYLLLSQGPPYSYPIRFTACSHPPYTVSTAPALSLRVKWLGVISFVGAWLMAQKKRPVFA